MLPFKVYDGQLEHSLLLLVAFNPPMLSPPHLSCNCFIIVLLWACCKYCKAMPRLSSRKSFVVTMCRSNDRIVQAEKWRGNRSRGEVAQDI